MKKKYLKTLYVAYGSNLNIEQMKRRCPGAKVVTEALLSGYRLIFRGNSRRYGVMNIESCKEGSVPIVLWRITKDDEEALDLYEGYPTLYKKKYIKCTIEEDNAYDCMAYVMTNSFMQAALPTERYYDTIKQGYKDFGFTTVILKNAYKETKAELLEEA